MLYAALTFWLLYIVLTATGVLRLWSDLVRPKIINIVLLPGTLVAQMGYLLGLLVTGSNTSNVSLLGSGSSADPEQPAAPATRVPVLGPVIVGLLPILACGAGIVLAVRWMGVMSVRHVFAGDAAQNLPTSLSAFWNLLHNLVSLMESTLDGLLHCNLADWRMLVFLYLLVCLTVRMAPARGNMRGALGAIVVLGGLAALAGVLLQRPAVWIIDGWPILSVSAAVLSLLLLLSLVVRGAAALVRVIRQR